MKNFALALALVCGCALGPRKPQVGLAPVSPVAPFHFSDHARQTKLTAVVFDAPLGQSLGEFSYGSGCTRRDPRVNVDGRVDLDAARYQDVFNDAMKRHGYPVDDQIEIFRNTKAHVADLLVAARILTAQINECFANPGNSFHLIGNVYLKVEWSVYSMIESKTIFTLVTEGSTNGDLPSSIGESGLLRVALGDAAERLALQASYRQMIDAATTATVASEPKEELIHIRLAKRFSGDLQMHLGAIKAAVVTVTANRGWGSGFVLSQDGLVLTAEHVVSGSKFAKVTSTAGKECYGAVVAANKRRDLALLRVECEGLSALPLFSDKLVEGDEVFAIGTPLSERLQFSVTKGVVSGVRKIQDVDFIQSDVKVLPGSSGGPLLDKRGNAVGVTSAGVAVESVPVGVNFFIPIWDLEKYLPVVLE